MYKELKLRGALLEAAGLALSLLLLSGVSYGQEGRTILSLPWGKEENQVGLVNKEEYEVCGPLSFCVDGEAVFLLDSVKQRIIKYEGEGNLGVAAEKVSGCAVCKDGNGGVFVLSGPRILHIPKTGEKKLQVTVKASDNPPPIIPGYGNELFLDARGNLCLRGVKQNVHRFSGIQAANHPRLQDIGHASLHYKIKRLDGNKVRLIGADDDGKNLISIPIKLKQGTPGATLFKGMDERGNLYVELECLEEDKIGLEVHRYSPAGDQPAVFQLPNNYFSTVYKKTEIAGDGSVYQMLTTKEDVRIIKYSK